jgi:hypothetical protein
VKLLILTADGSPDATYWQGRLKNAIACVSDATRGAFFVINKERPAASQIHVSPFIVDELSCIVTVFYGEIKDEIVDISRCC